jgi:hypothetical protein
VKKILRSERLHLEVLVRCPRSGAVFLGGPIDKQIVMFEVKDGEPAEVTRRSFRAVPPGASVSDFKIDAATRARVIDGAIAKPE